MSFLIKTYPHNIINEKKYTGHPLVGHNNYNTLVSHKLLVSEMKMNC